MRDARLLYKVTEYYAGLSNNDLRFAGADERLIRWIGRGTYQFAVLLTNENRLAKLEELIRNDDYPDLRVHLAIAPSPRDLPLFISADKDLAS